MRQAGLDHLPAVHLLAGVDEAGRGPLAGPVVAAAVILDDTERIKGLQDSKTLSEGVRLKLAAEIRERAVAWATGRAEVAEIDRLNILNASLLAMQRAVGALHIQPEYALIDGTHCPDLHCNVRAIVRGDRLVPAISAASILAKVTRDGEMIAMDALFPGYGFARHKGYPTKQHIEALEVLGVCAIHRCSYKPVKRFI